MYCADCFKAFVTLLILVSTVDQPCHGTYYLLFELELVYHVLDFCSQKMLFCLFLKPALIDEQFGRVGGYTWVIVIYKKRKEIISRTTNKDVDKVCILTQQLKQNPPNT